MKKIGLLLLVVMAVFCFLVVNSSDAASVKGIKSVDQAQISIGQATNTDRAYLLGMVPPVDQVFQNSQLANIADPTDQAAIQAVIGKNPFIGGDTSAGIVATVKNSEASGYHPKDL